MSDEQTGADFARTLFGHHAEPPETTDAQATEPVELDELRRAVAERHGIGPFADRLRGTTQAELEADAAAVAALTQRTEPTESGSIKERAKRNLREQLGFDPDLGLDQTKAAANRRIFSALHGEKEGEE